MRKSIVLIVVVMMLVGLTVGCWFILGNTSYNITVVEAKKGEITIDATEVKKGESVSITLKADEGYLVEYVIINGEKHTFEDLSNEAVYSKDGIEKDTVITARFISSHNLFNISATGDLSLKTDMEIPEYLSIPCKIGDTVVNTINNESFANRTTIKTYDLPDTLTHIKPGCIYGLTAFQGFVVDYYSKSFDVDGNGSLYTKNYSSLIYANKTALESFTIRASVKEIYNGAFKDLTNVRSFVCLNNSVFTENEGLLYTKDLTTLVAVPFAKTIEKTSYKYPNTLVFVEFDAFLNSTQCYMSETEMQTAGMSHGTLAFIKRKDGKKILIGTEGENHNIPGGATTYIIQSGCVGFRKNLCSASWDNKLIKFENDCAETFPFNDINELGLSKGMSVSLESGQSIVKKTQEGEVVNVVNLDLCGGTSNGHNIKLDLKNDRYCIVGEDPVFTSKEFYFYSKDKTNWMKSENRIDANENSWYALNDDYTTVYANYFAQTQISDITLDNYQDLLLQSANPAERVLVIPKTNGKRLSTRIAGSSEWTLLGTKYYNLMKRKTKTDIETAISYVIIPNTITEIGVSTFYNFTNLKELYIPFSCSKLDDGFMCGAGGIEKIVVSNANNVYLSTEDGLVYNKANTTDSDTSNDTNKSKLIYCPAKRTVAVTSGEDEKTYFIAKSAFWDSEDVPYFELYYSDAMRSYNFGGGLSWVNVHLLVDPAIISADEVATKLNEPCLKVKPEGSDEYNCIVFNMENINSSEGTKSFIYVKNTIGEYVPSGYSYGNLDQNTYAIPFGWIK